jgi:hypothetical protein
VRSLAHSRWRTRHLLAGLAALACANGVQAGVQDPPRIPSPIKVIWSASGARSGLQLTTAAVCSNRGKIPGTIGARFYGFSAAEVCTIAFGNVLPGETRTLTVDPIASMNNSLSCSGTPTLNQGRIEIFANTDGTLKFDCSVMLVDRANNPPLSLTRLTLYSESGVFRGDILFADGVDP